MSLLNRPVVEIVKETWKVIATKSGMDIAMIGHDNMKIISATSDGIVKLKVSVQDQQLNWSGNVHGGFMAYLVDVCGSLAITARTGSPLSGVSTDLSLSFMNGNHFPTSSWIDLN